MGRLHCVTFYHIFNLTLDHWTLKMTLQSMEHGAFDLLKLKIIVQASNSLDPATSSRQCPLCNHITYSKPDFGSLDIGPKDTNLWTTERWTEKN